MDAAEDRIRNGELELLSSGSSKGDTAHDRSDTLRPRASSRPMRRQEHSGQDNVSDSETAPKSPGVGPHDTRKTANAEIWPFGRSTVRRTQAPSASSREVKRSTSVPRFPTRRTQLRAAPLDTTLAPVLSEEHDSHVWYTTRLGGVDAQRADGTKQQAVHLPATVLTGTRPPKRLRHKSQAMHVILLSALLLPMYIFISSFFFSGNLASASNNVRVYDTLTVSQSGRVGINTESPEAHLEVQKLPGGQVPIRVVSSNSVLEGNAIEFGSRNESGFALEAAIRFESERSLSARQAGAATPRLTIEAPGGLHIASETVTVQSLNVTKEIVSSVPLRSVSTSVLSDLSARRTTVAALHVLGPSEHASSLSVNGSMRAGRELVAGSLSVRGEALFASGVHVPGDGSLHVQGPSLLSQVNVTGSLNVTNSIRTNQQILAKSAQVEETLAVGSVKLSALKHTLEEGSSCEPRLRGQVSLSAGNDSSTRGSDTIVLCVRVVYEYSNGSVQDHYLWLSTLNPQFCRNGFSWKNDVRRCVEVLCGTPPSVRNGTWQGSGRSVGTLLALVCTGPKLLPFPSEKLLCQSDGKWNASSVECRNETNGPSPSPSPSPEIGCGDQKSIVSLGAVFMADDFNTGFNPLLWNLTASSGVTIGTGCGSVSGNAAYFNGDGMRALTTFPVDTVRTKFVSFHIIIGSDLSATSCENADFAEDVIFEYSINDGSSYVAVETIAAGSVTSMTAKKVHLPLAARTAATILRFRQLSHSGADLDNFAIDNFYMEPTLVHTGSSTKVFVSVSSSHGLPPGGKVRITCPERFNLSSVLPSSGSASVDGTFSTSVSGRVVTLSRSGGTTTTGAVLYEVANVTVPSIAGLSGTFQSKYETSSGDCLAEDVSIPGVEIHAHEFEYGPILRHSSLYAGERTKLTLTFTSFNPIPSDGKIRLDFPSHVPKFNISGASLVSENVTDGTLSLYVSGDTLWLARTGASGALAGKSAISIVLAGIMNPSLTLRANDVIVTTLTGKNVAIDRGSAAGATLQTLELLATDGETSQFGASVSISSDGQTVLIGAPYDDDGGEKSGSAYVFEHNTGGWSQSAKLVASDGRAHDLFGKSVSISGDGNTALVGAYQDDDKGDRSGGAYVFSNTDEGWSRSAKLVASDGSADDEFGESVSISSNGRTALIGAKGNRDKDVSSGSAYVFTNNGGGWTQSAKLVASDGSADDNFGICVSISGDGRTALVGATGDDDSGDRSGSAYVFTFNDRGWTQSAKLVASDAKARSDFGESLTISGDGRTALVGSRSDDENGDRSGSAYVFVYSEGRWSQSAKLLASDGIVADHFGISVSISRNGQVVLIGAHYDDDRGTTSGSAYVFVCNGEGWSERAKLVASDGAASDQFGVSVSISGDGSRALIGARHSFERSSQTGSAYVV